MPDKPSELKPCPFCGAGTTEVQEHAIWQGTKYAEPISVSVVHWCDPVEGQPSRMLQKVGRDRASAIAAWNRRTPDRAAMVEVARRAIADCRNCDDPTCPACVSEANGVVTEYLAEQAGKDSE